MSKDMESLSRRLHQCIPLALRPGVLYSGTCYTRISNPRGMAGYRIVQTLPTADVAYIAGLVDGEGTVTLTRKHRNENHQLALSISNTDRSLLQYVLKTVGAGKITSKRTRRGNHTPSYTYALYNRQALGLLGQLLPYLRTYKAKRAVMILENYVRLTKRNGKYTAEQLSERQKFIREVMAIRPQSVRQSSACMPGNAGDAAGVPGLRTKRPAG